ncbi:Putative lumazine-binding [Pseudomonas arsenicoxydans]|uniref:Putative lumazine-binding n=1 Tax=Pseudomonas arsenicoxydans TaxID=702115 RepID=A0A1H0KR91_9PSED|nr:nuclear transport factor 2 family protein [Pseudomonas arsenicoxydans]SDO58459.1 Putative lumazine-binding [Pseudomonas arsenicoxydans]
MTALSTDIEQINLVVRQYVEGMVFADEALLRHAFHPDCRIIGHYHKELEWSSLDDFIGAINAESSAVKKDVQPFWRVIDFDITGDAAAVKVIDDFAGMRFTDYLSLLKVNDRWVIINKLYYYQE